MSAGAEKIKVIKVVLQRFVPFNQRSKKAKSLELEVKLRAAVKEGIEKGEADAIKAQLEEVGATVELK